VIVVLLPFSFVNSASAIVRVAVLELVNDTDSPHSSVNYLADKIRAVASENLLATQYLILTRESVRELLPDDVSLEDCVSSDCEVQIGRMMGVDYIVTGHLLIFADQLRINVKLHHTISGSYLGSRTAGGSDLLALEQEIESAIGPLFDIMEFHVRTERSGSPSQRDAESEIASEVVLRFDSKPPGAMVEVDGEAIGETPCAFALSEGFVEVVMQKLQYYPRRERIEVRIGMAPLIWELEPRTGRVMFRAIDDNGNAVSAPVVINGRSIARTYEVQELQVGRYRCRVQKNGYYWEDVVEVAEGKETKVEAVLDKQVDFKGRRATSILGIGRGIPQGGEFSNAAEAWILMYLGVEKTIARRIALGGEYVLGKTDIVQYSPIEGKDVTRELGVRRIGAYLVYCMRDDCRGPYFRGSIGVDMYNIAQDELVLDIDVYYGGGIGVGYRGGSVGRIGIIGELNVNTSFGDDGLFPDMAHAGVFVGIIF